MYNGKKIANSILQYGLKLDSNDEWVEGWYVYARPFVGPI